MTPSDAVELVWLPLGAGGSCVRWNGRLYEAALARRQRRVARPLFHSALQVTVDGVCNVIEMAPVWNDRQHAWRGVVVAGPVGAAWLGRWSWFRYEVRSWPGGQIPDLDEAVDSPQLLSTDRGLARTVLELVPQTPPLVWGRDSLGCGDMWNSNSLVAWLLAASGHDVEALQPPRSGRAPGWLAGLVYADRCWQDPANLLTA